MLAHAHINPPPPKKQLQVPCVASIDIIKLGHLDSSSTTPYLQKGSKVELPLWLIKSYREKVGGQRLVAPLPSHPTHSLTHHPTHHPTHLFANACSRSSQNGEDIFEVDPPKFLKQNYLDMIEADATVINLQSWCSYFFSFAITYLSLFQNEDLAQLLQDVRYAVLCSRVLCSRVLCGC